MEPRGFNVAWGCIEAYTKENVTKLYIFKGKQEFAERRRWWRAVQADEALCKGPEARASIEDTEKAFRRCVKLAFIMKDLGGCAEMQTWLVVNKESCKLIKQGSGERAVVSKEYWHGVKGRMEWADVVIVTTLLFS